MFQRSVIFICITCFAGNTLSAQNKREENIPRPPDSLKFVPPVVVEDPVYLIDGDTVFQSSELDSLAHYPGGMMELYKYLMKNLKYPAEQKDAGVQGKVMLKAVIEKTGKISHITTKNTTPSTLDEEVIRLLSQAGNWIPGRKNGKAVHSYISLPIYICLR